jgi:hypothetical protein
MKIVVVMEWLLVDRDANLIWIDTVTAEGKVTEPTSSVDENRKALMESLMQELFRKSHEAIRSSPEIRRFAASQNNQTAVSQHQ